MYRQSGAVLCPVNSEDCLRVSHKPECWRWEALPCACLAFVSLRAGRVPSTCLAFQRQVQAPGGICRAANCKWIPCREVKEIISLVTAVCWVLVGWFWFWLVGLNCRVGVGEVVLCSAVSCLWCWPRDTMPSKGCVVFDGENKTPHRSLLC